MKKNEKKMILILILISVLIIGVIYLATRPKQKEKIKEENTLVEEYVQVLDDGTKLNTSTKLNQVKTVNGLEFSNIRLTQRNGQSMILADVKNNTGSITKTILLDLILLDDQGKEIVKLAGAIAPLDIGQEKQFQVNATLDYANAYDFKIEIKN